MSDPLTVQEQVELQPLNTLAVSARARYLIEVTDASQVGPALAWAQDRGLDVLILGGGSNIVFKEHFPGLVLRMAIRGRRWEQVHDDDAVLVLGAGENWHESVLYAARSGYRGIENLALIPGTAGAAPVQNIGAYGVELCDTLVSVTAWDRTAGQMVCLSNAECQFAYRDSLFKHRPGRYVITEIRLRLSRSGPLHLDYRDLSDYLGEVAESELEPLAVAEAVMAIRRRKLPDPAQLPNVGSFFKNPVVDEGAFETLRMAFPKIAFYPQPGGVKLAAAWLIDQCGWKGYRNQRVGVHNQQALVLINHGGGNGEDILGLAARIRKSVYEKFGVRLEMEPGVVGGTGLPDLDES